MLISLRQRGFKMILQMQTSGTSEFRTDRKIRRYPVDLKCGEQEIRSS